MSQTASTQVEISSPVVFFNGISLHSDSVLEQTDNSGTKITSRVTIKDEQAIGMVLTATGRKNEADAILSGSGNPLTIRGIQPERIVQNSPSPGQLTIKDLGPGDEFTLQARSRVVRFRVAKI